MRKLPNTVRSLLQPEKHNPGIANAGIGFDFRRISTNAMHELRSRENLRPYVPEYHKPKGEGFLQVQTNRRIVLLLWQ